MVTANHSEISHSSFPEMYHSCSALFLGLDFDTYSDATLVMRDWLGVHHSKQTLTTLAGGLDGPWLSLPRTALGTELKHGDF